MGKYMLVVALNCVDPAREAELNNWYNEIHLPDVLETPGFHKATRWEHIGPKEDDAKFLALYEIETDDIEKTMQALQDTLAAKSQAGRMSDLGSRVLMGAYRQTTSLGS